MSLALKHFKKELKRVRENYIKAYNIQSESGVYVYGELCLLYREFIEKELKGVHVFK